jgi:hypothetical protein
MVIVVIAVCCIAAIAMSILSIGFGSEANAYRRRSSAAFLGTTEPEALKFRLVRRIQQKRKIEVNPSSNVSLRYGMKNWGLHLSRR